MYHQLERIEVHGLARINNNHNMNAHLVPVVAARPALGSVE
jgi:hypothetical protein